jgi:tyrosyl-tRNA synthetase
MGRELQKDEGQRPQTVMMVPLLEGLDGVQKMSKSLGNYIGITDAPNDMFGKIMSISDELMWRYYDLLSFKPIADINALKQQVAGGANPRDIKILLAKEIIARFHDEAAAEAAHQDFTQRFSKNALPDDIPQLSIQCDSGSMPIANLLKEAGLVDSTSEAIRMIKQGAVKLNGETKVEDTKLEVVKGSTEIYQVGKRKFAKISLI